MIDLEQTPVKREDIANLIWETSHADEGTISATGANIIADAILRAFTVTAQADDRPSSPEVVEDAELVVFDPLPIVGWSGRRWPYDLATTAAMNDGPAEFSPGTDYEQNEELYGVETDGN